MENTTGLKVKHLWIGLIIICISIFVISCGEQKKDITKISLIIPGQLGDKSFFDSAARGIRAVEAKYGEAVEVSIQEVGRDSANFEPSVLDALDDGADLLVTITWGMKDVIHSVAPQYPDKNFLIIDTDLDFESYNLDNTNAALFLPREGSYLAGAFAALVSDTGIIGFLGGMDDVGIHEFLVGYIEGAVEVNPDIRVLVNWVGAYNDAATGKTMALSQYAEGADIGFNVAGGSGLGQIQAAAETGHWAIGVDSDQYAILVDSQPNLANHVATSMVKAIDIVIEKSIDDFFAGKFKTGEIDKIGLKDQGVYLVQDDRYNSLLTDLDKALLQELEDRIISGDLAVSNAFSMDPQEVKELINSVKP